MADNEVKKQKLSDLRVVDLRNELMRRSLETTGVKTVLKERLIQAIRDEGHDPDEFLFEIDSEAADLKADFVETAKKGDEEETAKNLNTYEDVEAADMETSDPEKKTQDKLTTVSGNDLTTIQQKQGLARVVTPLAYHNWPTWKEEFQSVLLINGVAPEDYDAELSDDPKEKARDKLAYGQLVDNVGDQIKGWLSRLDTDSFKVAYNALQIKNVKRNDSNSVATIMNSLRKVFTTRLAPKGDLEYHISRISGNLDILEQAGTNLSSKIKALMLLETLNLDYECVRKDVQDWDEDSIDMESVGKALNDRYSALGHIKFRNKESSGQSNPKTSKYHTGFEMSGNFVQSSMQNRAEAPNSGKNLQNRCETCRSLSHNTMECAKLMRIIIEGGTRGTSQRKSLRCDACRQTSHALKDCPKAREFIASKKRMRGQTAMNPFTDERQRFQGNQNQQFPTGFMNNGMSPRDAMMLLTNVNWSEAIRDWERKQFGGGPGRNFGPNSQPSHFNGSSNNNRNNDDFSWAWNNSGPSNQGFGSNFGGGNRFRQF